MKSDVAFIIGNGRSRNEQNLKSLKDRGYVWACNAFYRDQGPSYDLPDWLVAIDDGIIEEILASDFPKEKFIVPPYDERWEPWTCNPLRPRSNAGFNAIREAIKAGAKTIFLLGFDFMLLDSSKSVSNIFDGTPNYGPETRASEQDNPNRVKYLSWISKHNPNVDIIFVWPREYDTIKTWQIEENLNIFRINYDELTYAIGEKYLGESDSA